MLNLFYRRDRLRFRVFSFILFCGVAGLVACSSTQKTGGVGLMSVVAQNVVRIAGAKAVRDLNLSAIKEQKTNVQVTGFVNDFNRGFVTNLISTQVEIAGGKLVDSSHADYIVDVGVNAAGNDNGTSGYLIGGAERTEGSVDLTVVTREAATGNKVSSQTIRGYAKYQQGTFFGISGSGAYFYKNGEDWVIIEDPARFK
jgi:hypothetical protein